MTRVGILPPKMLLRMSMLLFLVLHNASGQFSDGSHRFRPCELESLLRDLTYPEEGYELHAAALRNQLRNILERDPADVVDYQSLNEYGGTGSGGGGYENSGPYEDKRSYRSLLRDGAVFGKRNLGSLARAGLLRTPTNDYLKRSIATLAKNGQLPSSKEPDSTEDTSTGGGWTDDKRNVGSAYKSGYMLNGKRNIASLARKYELPGKRNIQSLLRTGMLPSIAPKRNVQSLVRDNALPHYGPDGIKRNIQTLVRDWNLPKQQQMQGGSGAPDNEKRNIQSLKSGQGHNGGRKKRELYYDEDPSLGEEGAQEILEPVYQQTPLDYEELMEAMSEAYPYYSVPVENHLEEKRFLGSLARSGALNRYHRFTKRFTSGLYDVFDDDDDDDDDDGQKDEVHDEQEDDDGGRSVNNEGEELFGVPRKRHIASLARSGWLPSFRPSRGSSGGRFSRSGRARSQIVEFYRQPERLRQPTAAVCRRCDVESSGSGSRLRGHFAPSSPAFVHGSWAGWGVPSDGSISAGIGGRSTWGSTPPRVTALHWRRFREPRSAPATLSLVHPRHRQRRWLSANGNGNGGNGVGSGSVPSPVQ
ncbi:uncharacterized protein LOC129748824 isoform X2 [Uranotaenia lowii]|uniref:uncharacterized protein LOC129748824 isoform X2 n=1 Tax=Uranotaenia lowii TaxID=190385 RepID=UPI00247ABDCD|nr:uncharacterized protein LOC129748824 isoform X2 [Uranotaenia lowii]